MYRRGNDADQSNTAQKSPKLVHTLDGVDKHEVVAILIGRGMACKFGVASMRRERRIRHIQGIFNEAK